MVTAHIRLTDKAVLQLKWWRDELASGRHAKAVSTLENDHGARCCWGVAAKVLGWYFDPGTQSIPTHYVERWLGMEHGDALETRCTFECANDASPDDQFATVIARLDRCIAAKAVVE